MSKKPKYKPESENALWKRYNSQQTDTHEAVAIDFNITTDDARKLHMLWSTGSRDSFNQAYYSLFDGSPTKFT